MGLARTWETVFSGTITGPAEHRIRLILAALGILTALVGTAMSLVETHLRRLLAFVVVAHMGLYLLGFSLLRTAALGGVALLAAGDGLTKAALFLAFGVLHRHRRLTGGRPIAGQGAGLAVAAGLVVLGALALADLPPFASSVGKDLLGAAAGAAHPVVEVVFAVTVVSTSAAILAATGRVWRGETTDHLSPAEEQAESPTGSGTAVLLAAPALLLLASLGLGLIPHLADHSVTTAATFADRKGYATAVLDGRRAPVATITAPPGTLAARILDLAETAAAIVVGALILFHTRLREMIAIATAAMRRLHSGHVGDQVTWAVFGLAVLAGLSGVALR